MSVHLGDIGTVIQLILTRDGAVFDISAASVKQLRLSDASESLRVKNAAFTSNGTDGKLQYTTIAGDLDCLGTVRVQAYVVLPTGSWSSDQVAFTVDGNL